MPREQARSSTYDGAIIAYGEGDTAWAYSLLSPSHPRLDLIGTAVDLLLRTALGSLLRLALALDLAKMARETLDVGSPPRV